MRRSFTAKFHITSLRSQFITSYIFSEYGISEELDKDGGKHFLISNIKQDIRNVTTLNLEKVIDAIAKA
jgi:hypothetical protein